MSAGAGTVALSLGLCLCAGQLVATPAASAATITATPVVTAAAAKIKPKLTNSATRTITKGKSVKVTAKVVNPKTGKVVTKGSVRLQALRNGKWHTWAAKPVNSKGLVAITAKPGVTTWFRTQYTGYGQFGYGTSAGLKITVKKPKVAAGVKILNEAKKHKGALYKYGAAGPSRFDCSGFTKYVYKKAVGKSLPHKANSQQKYGKSVSKANKKVGDLIVFRSGSYGYHAGIYAGGGYIYDSPHSGARVGKHKIWSSNYVVRRLAA
ncbi:C40 family peptidase [Symbioplanes lichenis]|uniref:C40 family peptidase n=1 Tax=Symbioplanes lichenis TaxID=1629072 RepID=UPI00273941CE|nr:C40 family peptidase [Actinoplanes lichenis]